MFASLEEELLARAKLRKIGVGFSEFMQENNFIDLTLMSTSVLTIELSSFSRLAISS
jgi:hypothetical protein